MSEVLEQPANVAATNLPAVGTLKPRGAWVNYLPALLPIIGALIMFAVRAEMGGVRFISDGALIMIALACYLTSAVFLLTNIYATSSTAERFGLWLASLGAFFNLSSWFVRWLSARDHEMEKILSQGGEMPWFWRYVPFANLYDLSIAFAFGAAITTLVLMRRKNTSFIGALSMPLVSLILLLAVFIGNEFIDLPPILDSYWRPIHVSIASLGYGVALVCFAIAVMYLLKDGVKTEAMAIWSSIFALSVFATVSRFSVFTTATYSASTFIMNGNGRRMPVPLRADIPYVGWTLIVAAVLLVGAIFAFGRYLSNEDDRLKLWGHRLLKLSLVAQAAAVALLVSGIRTITDVPARINRDQLPKLGAWVIEKWTQTAPPEQVATMSSQQLQIAGLDWLNAEKGNLFLSLNANPVELAALITALAATGFVILFSFRTERLRLALPSLEKLDSLIYRTATLAFVLIVMLLITGAIWANESWGRYWAWDSKETGAFIACLTYAAYLHTRISRGWSGRLSAYFAIVGFLLVIFTYLGVSYLLPGLHSYA